MTSGTESHFDGGCLCGAVRFRVQPPTLFCCHCHCRYCRSAHGAAFVTWVGVPEAGFTLIRGQEALAWYRSSEQSRRGFCRTCGSTMFYASALAPGEMHVVRAAFDGDVDRAPSANIFYEQRAPWAEHGDTLRAVRGDGPELARFTPVTAFDER